jgi:hypothetical protein
VNDKQDNIDWTKTKTLKHFAADVEWDASGRWREVWLSEYDLPKSFREDWEAFMEAYYRVNAWLDGVGTV